MKYAIVGATDLDDELGNEAVTNIVARGETFGEAVALFVLVDTERPTWTNVPEILMTTEPHWSGYSEYTITSEWSEVYITVPAWNFERHFESVADLFAALAKAEARRP